MPQRKFRLSTTLLWAWALALVLAFAGCAPEFEMESCTSEEDCFPDEVCYDGLCKLDDGSYEDVEDDTEENGEEDVEEEDPVVATIEISPASGTVAVGLSIPFQAKGYDEDGELVEDAIFLWSTKSSSVASVNNAGVVTGQAEGETEVVASWADDTTVSGSASVTVVFGDIDRVEVLPEEATANVGDTVLYEATVYTEGDVEVTDAQIIWSVEDETVAEVDEDGLVKAIGVGETEVIANVEGIEGRALFIVENTPPVAKAGDDQTVRVDELVTVSATDSVDLEDDFEDLSFAWEFVEDPSNGADELEDADSATATFRPSVVGEYVLQVTVTDSHGGEDTATVTITVEPAPLLDVINVEPTSATLVYGEVLELEVTVEDGEGNVLADAEVEFTTDDPEQQVIAHIGGERFMALGEGEAKIFVDAPETSAPTVEISITVEWGTVEKLTLNQTTADLEIDDTLQLVATAENESDWDITDYVTLTWATEDPDVATVDNNGLVSAVGEGQTTITVSVDGETASATITVGGEDDEPVPASIEVDTTLIEDEVGATGTLSVTVKDEDDQEISGAQVEFVSDDPSVIDFHPDPKGAWEIYGVGSATITVTSTDDQSITATVQVTATWGDIESIVPSQYNLDLEVGQSETLTAEARNIFGKVILDSEITFDWTSDTPSVAAVDDDGVVTGVSAGTAKITVEAGGKSEYVDVTVTDSSTVPVPATIEITSTVSELILGADGTLSAIVKDADDEEIQGAEVKWSSDTPAVATIDEDTGEITTVAPGTATFIATSVDDNSVTATVSVEIVVGAAALIEIEGPPLTVAVGDELTLSVVVFNGEAEDISEYVTVEWASADDDIASVDANTGVVTGVAAGTVTITVTVDGAVSEDVEVTVEAGQQPAEFLETFDEYQPPQGYKNGTFTGVEGIEWEYSQAMYDADETIDGRSMILNFDKGNSFIKAESIPDGISSFSVDYRRAYTNTKERQFEVRINDEVIETVSIAGDDTEVRTLTISGLDIKGPFSLEIRASSGTQFTIDNIRWTSNP